MEINLQPVSKTEIVNGLAKLSPKNIEKFHEANLNDIQLVWKRRVELGKSFTG